MDHEEHRPRTNLAERDVAVFLVLMDKVTQGNGIRVVEYQFSRLEIDVMLSEILRTLPLVPFKTRGFMPLSFEDNNTYLQMSIHSALSICQQTLKNKRHPASRMAFLFAQNLPYSDPIRIP